jgi:hypothetical protein
MVTRTTDRILVSEEQLADALRIVEAELARAGLDADIEVILYADREIEDYEYTLLLASVPPRVPVSTLAELLVSVDKGLEAAGLRWPATRLLFDVKSG